MEQLGINIGYLLAQIFNFLIIVFLLQKFLYKPVLSMLDKRKKEIEEGIKLKSTMEEEKEKLVEKRKKVLKDANAEGQRIIASAIEEAKKEEERILEKARLEAKSEFDKRMEQVQKEKTKMVEEARKQALLYAVTISEKILGTKLTKSEQERLVKESFDRVQRV
jgi:F-type H+-transporting ATPase subunit b